MDQIGKGYELNSVTRRGFLAAIGAAGATAALQPEAAFALLQNQQRDRFRTDRFTRIFKDLPPFAEVTPAVERALAELGAAGGLMDAKDPLLEGPTRLITNPELSPNNLDNPALTAGVTFLGQFLDHDMTFDASSRLGIPTDPERSRNTRTPALDLDSLYGSGPTADPHLYDPNDRAKLKLEHGGQFEDLPRGADGRAIISDPRNDENIIIAGLQIAFICFHNRVVDKLRQDRDFRREVESDFDSRDSNSRDFDSRDSERRDTFSLARQVVTWHYQWIIVHEFLPQIIGSSLVNDILFRGLRFYDPDDDAARMPVEFQGAAYRFGHSLVRPSYRANLAGDLGQPFFGFIFSAAGEGQLDPVDMRGGSRSRRRFIGWQTFFNFGGAQAQNVRPPKLIDTKISTPLFNLPLAAIASGAPPQSLPQRNLLRHLTWSIPSGQSIANAMRIPALTSSQIRELAVFGVGLERSTPLWYYILKEAELSGGARLAGVGARIVGEVFIGLLKRDEDSYLSENPRWTPSLPGRVRQNFTMVDLLTFARVDPATRGQ